MLTDKYWNKAPYAEAIIRKERGDDGDENGMYEDNYNYLINEKWMNENYVLE